MTTQKDKIDNNLYQRIHYWLRINFGIPVKCKNQRCNRKSACFSYALKKNKKYEFDRNNFIILCRSCHSKYDLTADGRERIRIAASQRKKSKWNGNQNSNKKFCKRGHKLSKQNTILRKTGYRNCRKCKDLYNLENKEKNKKYCKDYYRKHKYNR